MKTRRILSLVVAAILLVSTLTVVGLLSVNADETEISDAAGFKAMTADGNYKLTADIDLTGSGFTTIEAFSGTLDGNGKRITGISTPLFDTLSGTVKNVTLEGAITTDASDVGALAKTAGNGAIVTNVTNEVDVVAASGSNIGGFVGKVANDATVSFTRVVNNGDVQGKSAVGGVIAYIGTGVTVTVNESINTGTILMADADAGVGGILGSGAWGDNKKEVVSITFCVNTGAVSSVAGETSAGGRGRAAGIIGRLNKGAQSLTIDSCYNTGTITLNGSTHGDDSAAGIAAYVQKAYITNCYNIGDLSSTTNRYEIGRSRTNNSSTCSNNYYIERGIGNHGTTQATACADKAELVEALKAIGYSVNPAQNDGYPILAWQCTIHSTEYTCTGGCLYCGKVIGEAGEHTAWEEWTEVTPSSVKEDGEKQRVCGVCGTVETAAIPATGTITPIDGVYTVTSEDQLVWLTYAMNADTVPSNVNITLAADITLTEGVERITTEYSGNFDGAGYKISGLTDVLFKQFSGVLKDVTLEGAITTTDAKMGSVAIETGFGGAKFYNVTSKVDLNLSTNGDTFGGLVGHAYGHAIFTDCSYSGTMTVTAVNKGHIGGIVGYMNSNGANIGVDLTNCLFDGTIALVGNCGALNVGGLLGYNKEYGGEFVKNCVVTGTITVAAETTEAKIGGLVGAFRSSGKDSTIENSVFNGTISGTGTVGAIIGAMTDKCAIVNCGSLATELPIVPTAAGTITDSFAGADVETVGEPFTMGGVGYQRYNFGYVNTATSQCLSSLSSEDAVKPYISIRDDGTAHDLRFAFLTNFSKLGGASALNVTVTFTKGDATVKTYTGAVTTEQTDLKFYQGVVAADKPYFAADGSAFFALVVTDIPDGEWDTAVVTVTNGSGAVVLDAASVNYADIVG